MGAMGLSSAALGEAALAVDWLVGARLERHGRFLAALGADHRIHLALTARRAGIDASPLGAAIRATAGRMIKALLLVELLLSGREDELRSTVTTHEGLVLGRQYGLLSSDFGDRAPTSLPGPVRLFPPGLARGRDKLITGLRKDGGAAWITRVSILRNSSAVNR